MRKFLYFLYDNFSESDILRPSDNPRRILNHRIDGILSDVVDAAPNQCSYADMCNQYSEEIVNSLISTGILRKDCQSLLLDSAVFVKEDVHVINHALAEPISCLVNQLEQHKTEIYALAEQMSTGFAIKRNLYHMLCGAIFDGAFFNYLSARHLVTTTRLHPSGLDYLVIIYEDCQELNKFSQNLLCSYNRFTDGKRTLQSFGDAAGNRKDFFRFARQRELGTLPAGLSALNSLWTASDNGQFKNDLLDETQCMIETGVCREEYKDLLSAFHYLKDGKINVPVFRESDRKIMRQIESIVEACLHDDMSALLSFSGELSHLISCKHGVSAGEIANELYHIVFGQMNEELVLREFVEQPEYHVNEGRYLKAIELFD